MVDAKILFFKSQGDFRKWLEKNHEHVSEQWVGFYKKQTGKPSITWPESVDEALCFGWIDGIRKSIDEESYKIRFTPRKVKSKWSAVNLKRVQELIRTKRISPAGMKAYEAYDENQSGVYSYEQRPQKLDPPYEKKLRANKKAWNFFQAQPPGYRRTASWWILSAKGEGTRQNRLRILIEDSEKGQRIGPLRRNPK